MELLECGHAAYPSQHRMCVHLLVPEDQEEEEHVRLLSGHGMGYDLCCWACDKADAGPQLVQVCQGCMDRNDDDEIWGGTWRGEPEVLERPEPVDTTVTRVPLPDQLRDPLDWGPANDPQGGSAWLFLTRRGALVRFNADTREHQAVASKALPRRLLLGRERTPNQSDPHRSRLHVSPQGRYAAVVNDYGNLGVVIDLRSGRKCLTLRGNAVRAYAVPFALAFVEHEDRTLVVHRTGDHRLDVSDPATGELLTGRHTPEPEAGQPVPEHYSSYFHGAVQVSPSGRWIADHGWYWTPAATLAVWDLRRWLEGNPWESEDGPTRQELYQRLYCLNEPFCWISEDLVALSGIGKDDDDLLDGVQIFDAETGTRTGTFAGPRPPLMADNRRLYAGSAAGLQIWDPFTGERTGTVPGFLPERHHLKAAELAGLRHGALERWATR